MAQGQGPVWTFIFIFIYFILQQRESDYGSKVKGKDQEQGDCQLLFRLLLSGEKDSVWHDMSGSHGSLSLHISVIVCVS